MKIKLENVGKIGEAQIELNGITVIAGENGTGKSTVGKMLFCVFKSFYKIEEHIRNERISTVRRAISNYFHELPNRILRGHQTFVFAKRIVDERDCYKGNKQQIIEEIMKLLAENASFYGKYPDEDSLNAFAEKINSFLYVEDDALIKSILWDNIEMEFGTKLGHLNYPEENTRVYIEIKGNAIEFELSNGGEADIFRSISLAKEIIYIDDPFVLDNLNERKPSLQYGRVDHRSDLLNKLANDKDETEFSALEELVVKGRLQKIFHLMNEVCDGELSADGEMSDYIYKTDKLQGGLEIANLSTGMKNFVILKQLLQNGSIDENGIVILDEPEIHLHPEWQLKFAEIIVLIQKEFNIHVLLNTHSPYFLNAIEIYADKYGIANKCKYYLAEEAGDRAKIVDVSENIESIYAKLARPLQDLENLGYRDGNTIR